MCIQPILVLDVNMIAKLARPISCTFRFLQWVSQWPSVLTNSAFTCLVLMSVVMGSNPSHNKVCNALWVSPEMIFFCLTGHEYLDLELFFYICSL